MRRKKSLGIPKEMEIVNLSGRYFPSEIAKKVGVSVFDVQNIQRVYKIRKLPKTKYFLLISTSEEEREKILEMYPEHSIEEIADTLKIGARRVRYIARMGDEQAVG